ncbi:MAG: hypothetical protein ICV80_13525 [Microcoleus sp. T1-bin1]|nr:hypothetical protein [Microcoleus sp. T1-bin1]
MIDFHLLSSLSFIIKLSYFTIEIYIYISNGIAIDFNPVTYGYIKDTLRISDYSITVNDFQRDGGITLSVCIVNHGKCGYLVNNLCGHFYLKDEKQNKFQLVIDTAIIIEPSLTQDIALKCENFSATGKLRLHFSPKPKEILIIALDNTTEE